MQLEIFDSKTVDKKNWNDQVASIPEGNIFQTSFWAGFLEEYLLYKPVYFLATESGKIKALCLGFIRAYRHYGYFERFLLHKLLWLARYLFPAFISQEGILIFEDNKQAKKKNARFLLDEIIKFCSQNKVVSIDSLSFPVSQYNDSDILPKNNLLFTKIKWTTYIVDLEQPEEDAWQSLDHSARKAIKKAIRDGIQVKRVQDEIQLRTLYDFNRKECRRKKRRIYSYKDESMMWKHLRKENCLERFVAYYNSNIIASLGIWHYNRNLHEFFSIQSQFAYEKKLYGNDLIKWEIIKWGIKNGYRQYNLAGVNPHPKDVKEEGIRRFKKKWGGKIVHYNIYSKIYRRNIQKILDLVKKTVAHE